MRGEMAGPGPLRALVPGPQGEEGGGGAKAGDQGPPALPQPC